MALSSHGLVLTGDRILVQLKPADDLTPGGLHIPGAAKEKPMLGRVLAIGPGARDAQGKVHPVAIPLKHDVLFDQYVGKKVVVDGEDCLILREEDVIAYYRGQ